MGFARLEVAQSGWHGRVPLHPFSNRLETMGIVSLEAEGSAGLGESESAGSGFDDPPDRGGSPRTMGSAGSPPPHALVKGAGPEVRRLGPGD